MGFRFRKSFRLLPGIRVNVSHRGVSLSAGPRVAKVSASSNGRVTRTFTLPGTGISHSRTLRSGRRRSAISALLRRRK